MKRFAGLIVCLAAMTIFLCVDVVARGPGGGGRGGGGASRGGAGARGGGGMSSSRSPSMSRSSSGMSRPSGGSSASRPSGGAASRPNGGAASRPSGGAASRPSTGSRPGGTTSRQNTGGRPSTGSRPSTGGRPGSSDGRPGTPSGNQPSNNQVNDFLDLPKAGQGNRGANGGSDFLQNRPSQGNQNPRDREGTRDRESTAARSRLNNDRVSDNRSDRLDNRSDARNDRLDNRSDRRDTTTSNRLDRRDNLSDHRFNRVDNVTDRKSNRVDRRTEVRQQVRNKPPRRDFWRGNRNASRYRWNRPYRWATWGSVAAWFPWGLQQPVTYNYGDNVYVEGENVYVGEEAVGTRQEYQDQAFAIAATADELAPKDAGEWLSLGVFAMTQDGQASGPKPTLFLQLAVSKDGMLAGTYYVSTTEETLEIAGAVDKDSQRVAWTVGGKDWPVMETGLANLTEDESPSLIHFENGQTQQWLLVRLEDPEGSAAQ